MIGALVQLRTRPWSDMLSTNLPKCAHWIQQAKQAGARMIFFPEASDYISGRTDDASLVYQHELVTPIQAHAHFLHTLQTCAQEYGMWVSVGLHEETVDDKRPFNTHYVINANGEIATTYRKLHLFDFAGTLPGESPGNGNRSAAALSESSQTRPGTQLPEIVDTPLGRVAPMICYDLRFPELASALTHDYQLGQSNSMDKGGADVLLYPSAFTMATGAAGHWEVLCRARAIETQSYVVASAQCGRHSERRESWGHSLVVDPWGKPCPSPDQLFILMSYSFYDKYDMTHNR